MKILALPFPGLRFFALALTISGLSLSALPGSLFAQDKPATTETTTDKPADDASEPADVSEVKDIRIIIKTDKGDIKATMYAIKAPLTSANFLNLAKRDYYDGVIFHRVVPNFVIQGGDPTGTGRGTPGYTIENEIDPDLLHDDAGIFSMARKPEPDSAGSQFSSLTKRRRTSMVATRCLEKSPKARTWSTASVSATKSRTSRYSIRPTLCSRR